MCYVCIFIPRLRVRQPSNHQYSEQVLSPAAASILFRLFTGLRQTSSSEVRDGTCNRQLLHLTKHRYHSKCFLWCMYYNKHSVSVSSFLDSALRLSLYRNSSSRERSDRFDRSDRGSDRFDRRDDRRDDRDRNRLQVTKRSFSRENEERSREREQRGSADPVRRVASMTDDRDRGSRERTRSKENGTWHDVDVET